MVIQKKFVSLHQEIKNLLRIIGIIIKDSIKGDTKKLETQTIYTIYMPGEKLPYDPETIIDVEFEIVK